MKIYLISTPLTIFAKLAFRNVGHRGHLLLGVVSTAKYNLTKYKVRYHRVGESTQ
jgi:hypothetical protein